MTTKEQAKVVELMALLDCTEEEALQVIADDKAIDKGEKMAFDLTKEQEKIARSYAKTSTHTITQKVERKRKENPTKAGIIKELANFLSKDSENAVVNVEITNKERQIAFKIGDASYELTLIQKRKPKT